HDLLEVDHEHLPVADVPGAPALAERIDGRLDELVGYRDLEAHLLGQADLDGRAAIRLDAVELPTVALHPAHREPPHLGAIQGFKDSVRLLGADNPDHQLHDSEAFPRERRASLSRCTNAPAGAYPRATRTRPAQVRCAARSAPGGCARARSGPAGP